MSKLIRLMKKHIFILISIMSLCIIGMAIIADPFSLPFQDWDRMPEQQKQWYIQQSEICTYFKYLGATGLLIGLAGSVYNFIKKPEHSAEGES